MSRSPFRLRLALVSGFVGLAVLSAAPTTAEGEPALSTGGPAAGLATSAGPEQRGGGLDLALPAMESFRGWPPETLLEQPYWLAWGRDSLRRATLFQRPVLFVLTVNWNRAARKFEEQVLDDPRVLRAINGAYIAVRVNADLRPDLRERYQTGAWPAVAFLLPNGLPMLSQANEMGRTRPITTSAVDAETLVFLLGEGDVYWRKWSRELIQAGQTWSEREGPGRPLRGVVDAEASEYMARWLQGNADLQDGGFGAAPKFVLPGLTEYGGLRKARSHPEVARHNRLTLERLVDGPLFDRRDGGIHRVAAAPSFERIEFEKPLDVNAALLRELCFALREEESEALRAALEATSGFITRVLARPQGGFYLAQGADTASAEGGAYWTAADPKIDAPPVDRLVLAGPNALAGAAVLRAAVALDDPELARAGRAAVNLAYERGYATGRGVRHVIEPDEEEHVFLVAQADGAMGFVDAYETTGERRFLAAARDIADFALRNLSDPQGSALRDHLGDPSSLGLLGNTRRPLRSNVRLARVLLRLSLHGLGEEYRQAAERILAYFNGDLSSFRVHGIEAALAVEEAIAEPLLIRIDGAPERPQTRALRAAALSSPWTWTMVTTGDTGSGSAPTAQILWQGRQRTLTGAAELRGAILDLTGRTGS